MLLGGSVVLVVVRRMMMMMTLCIRYKAQLAVANFIGPRHTTHFVLLEKVSRLRRADYPPTNPNPKSNKKCSEVAASGILVSVHHVIIPAPPAPRSARRRLVLVRPCCLAAQPAHCPCPPGRGGCVVALVVALRRSPSCRQHGCVAVRCAELGNPFGNVHRGRPRPRKGSVPGSALQ